MTGSEGHESPLEQVTGEKDVTPEEERGGGRAQEHDTRREERDGTPGSTSGDTAGDASGDASGDGEPDAGS